MQDFYRTVTHGHEPLAAVKKGNGQPSEKNGYAQRYVLRDRAYRRYPVSHGQMDLCVCAFYQNEGDESETTTYIARAH